jgi:hypothetical protein
MYALSATTLKTDGKESIQFFNLVNARAFKSGKLPGAAAAKY